MTDTRTNPAPDLGELSPLARPDKPPTYFTFYSFKGGVGRSMALINCAAILAGRGFRVLAMDLDLEAPGISYFEAEEKKDRKQPGFIDILHDAIHQGEKAPFAAADPVKAIFHYIRRIEVPENLRTFDDGQLFVMPAGKLDDDYEKRRQEVNIPRLYQSGRGRPLIKLLRQRLDECRLFDFVLLDSRTGFSDEAGICIRDLSDHLVMLLGLNRQNALGSARFLTQLKKAKIKPKSIDIVLTPIPVGEDELFNERRKDVAKLLGEALGGVPKLDLELPYHPRLALIETPHIFGRRHDFLYDAYHRLETRMRERCGTTSRELSGRAWRALGEAKHEEALTALGLLSRVDLEQATDLLRHGVVSYRKRIEGEPYCQLLVRLHPNDADALNEYAGFLWKMKRDHGGAEQLYERAIQAHPKHANSLGSYANFLTGIRKDHDRAEELYTRAAASAPENLSILERYAWFLWGTRRDHGRAEDLYRRAIEIDPKNARALGSYAYFLMAARKDGNRAAELCNRAVDVAPKDAMVLGIHAYFFAEINKDYIRAEDVCRQAIELGPEHANLRANYSKMLFALGRTEEGNEQSHAAWELSSEDDVCLELCFYAYAHDAPPPPDQPLARLKALLLDGTRSPYWHLEANVERAVADGHPEPEFLAVLAQAVADETPIEALDEFAPWRDTAPLEG